MAKKCDICGKAPVTGSTISHAHNVNKRIFYPNLRSLKTVIKGTRKKIKICMKCLKAQGRK